MIFGQGIGLPPSNEDEKPVDAAEMGPPEDLPRAGAVVGQAIEFMVKKEIDPIIVASALLAGSVGLLLETVGEEGAVDVLRNALSSIESGELRAEDSDGE